jgi:arsenate reductase (glutaredoxin)
MLTIFHNPKCSKSREGICFLDEIKQPYQVVKYLEKEITFNELKEIIKKLAIKPIDLVRTKEKIWIENYKGKELKDDEIIEIMIKNPKLIERPIIVNGNKAVIARPTDRIKEIL